MGQIVGEVERAIAGKAEVHLLSRVDSNVFSPKQIREKIEEVGKQV